MAENKDNRVQVEAMNIKKPRKVPTEIELHELCFVVYILIGLHFCFDVKQ